MLLSNSSTLKKKAFSFLQKWTSMHSCLSRDRGSCDLFLVETSLLLFGIDTVARAFVFESGSK